MLNLLCSPSSSSFSLTTIHKATFAQHLYLKIRNVRYRHTGGCPSYTSMQYQYVHMQLSRFFKIFLLTCKKSIITSLCLITQLTTHLQSCNTYLKICDLLIETFLLGHGFFLTPLPVVLRSRHLVLRESILVRMFPIELNS